MALDRLKPRLALPKVVGFDGDLGVLALAWIESGETLFATSARRGRLPADLGASLGRNLAWLHSATGTAGLTWPQAVFD